MDWNEKLSEILTRAKTLTFNDEQELDMLKNKICLYSEKLFDDKDKYGNKANDINFWSMVYPCSTESEKRIWDSGKNQLINLIKSMIEDADISANALLKSNTTLKSDTKVFIVHGHNEMLKYNVSNWLHELELEPIILHLKANGGISSIINKIEKYSDVGCAIILLTADDKGKSKLENDYKDRARQNVIFEAGYFIGKLGAENVILLYQEGVELPGDLNGCIYILADEYNGWKESIRVELDNMEMKFKH